MSESDGKSMSESNNLDDVLRRVHAQTPVEVHAVRSRTIGAYTAFVAAALIASITNSAAIGAGKLVICLFSLSIPALVGHLFLDRTVTVIQQRRNSAFRGAAIGLGIIPSIIAFAVLIGHVSVVGASLFVLGCGFWFLVVDVVTAAGVHDKDSTI